MPRKSQGSGGARTGTPGKSYSNRSDLNGTGTLPVATAPGQQYGQASAQAQAQKMVPMAGGPPSPLPSNPAQAGPQIAAAGNPSPGPMPGPATAAMPIQPGGLPPLDAPSERPSEPVTTPAPQVGLPMNRLSDMLSGVAQASGNPSVAYFAQTAKAQGL